MSIIVILVALGFIAGMALLFGFIANKIMPNHSPTAVPRWPDLCLRSC